MKIIVVLFGFVVAVLAEKEAPYPPSGWKPDGPQLTYPPPTPSREYGPATTPAPTELPTQPPATYIPSEQGTEAPGGYQRYQNQRFTSQASAQLNQGNGQFFIITPQGQLQHIPIVVPQNRNTNKDAETVEPQQDDRNQNFGRVVQEKSSQPNQRKPKTQTNENRQKTQSPSPTSANLVSITPDGRFERVQESQKQQASAGATQGQTQFIAFIPAVPLNRVQTAAMIQSATPQNGQYHVISPNGRLQRVQFMNMLGPDNRLTANVQYQEVDPIRGPLYTFGSPLVRVL